MIFFDKTQKVKKTKAKNDKWDSHQTEKLHRKEN